MTGTKVILIAAEIAALVCSLVLIWMIALEEVENDIVKAFITTMFIICAIMFQSMQQRIKW